MSRPNIAPVMSDQHIASVTGCSGHPTIRDHLAPGSAGPGDSGRGFLEGGRAAGSTDRVSTDFYRDHPEWRLCDSDATEVTGMSYCFPQARAYLVGLLERAVCLGTTAPTGW